MEWLIIIGLILFGLGLIIIEVIFVPGTTIVGIAGLAIGGYGIYLTYASYGTATGHWVLGASVLFTVVAFVYSFKVKAWERFSLKNTISSRVNQDIEIDLKVGDVGKAVSDLKPVGSGLFNEMKLEVRSKGEWIGSKQDIRVIKIDHQKIYVEPINQK